MAGLLNLIAALSGHNKVRGGPFDTGQVDPNTGQKVFTYNPYSAKGGFLSHWGRGRGMAEELNARIGGQAFLQQEEGRRLSSEAQKERTFKEGESEKEGKRRIREKKVEGRVARKNAARQQALDLLKTYGIVSEPTTRNEMAVDEALTGKRIKGLATKEDIENEVYASELGRESAMRAIIDKNLEQGAKNLKEATTIVGPDQTARIPKMYNQPADYFRGPRKSQRSTTTGGLTIQTESGPQTIGGETKVLTGTTEPLTPEEEAEAANIPSPDATPAPEPSTTPRQRIILPDPGVSTKPRGFGATMPPSQGPQGLIPQLIRGTVSGIKEDIGEAARPARNLYRELWSGEPTIPAPRPSLPPPSKSKMPVARTTPLGPYATSAGPDIPVGSDYDVPIPTTVAPGPTIAPPPGPIVSTVPPDYGITTGPQIPNIPIRDPAPAPYLSPLIQQMTNAPAVNTNKVLTAPPRTNAPFVPKMPATNIPAPTADVPFDPRAFTPAVLKEIEAIAALERQLGNLSPNATEKEIMQYTKVIQELERRTAALEAITGLKMPK